MRSRRTERSRGGPLVAIATCIALGTLSTLGAPGCAESSNAAGPDAGGSVTAPAADAGEDASVDAGADIDAAPIPCAHGHLCRASVPFTRATVTALTGRAKNDVWASGSDGLLMHYDGTQWTALDSDIDEALTSLALTADETWGNAGTLVVRRRIDAGSIRKVRLQSNYGTPSTLGVLPGAQVYMATDDQRTPVVWLELETSTLTPLPNPVLPWANEAQQARFRASFLGPQNALWFVGDRAAIARYPLADAGDGGPGSPLGRGVLVPVASHADLLAVWGHGEHLFAAGRGGTVLHFDGSRWRELETGTSVTLKAIFGLSPTDVWAAGEQGTVLHYDGNSWKAIDLGTYDGSVDCIWGSAPDDVWLGGENRLFHWGPLP